MRADLYRQVDVIGHQTESMDTTAEALNPFLKEKTETASVLVIQKNIGAAIATQHDMIDCSGIMYAGFAGHGLESSRPHQSCKFTGLTLCSLSEGNQLQAHLSQNVETSG